MLISGLACVVWVFYSLVSLPLDIYDLSGECDGSGFFHRSLHMAAVFLYRLGSQVFGDEREEYGRSGRV